MDLASALLLGLVQGLTEFLPISSSGHLVLAQHFLGWTEPQVLFDVCLHIGTFAAVLAVFWRDILGMIGGGLSLLAAPGKVFRQHSLTVDQKTCLLVVLGTVPIVALGLFARDFIEGLFASTTAVCVNLLVTGTFLWLTRYAPKGALVPRTTSYGLVLLVGLAQSIALAPGISRSGSTISAALMLGLDRDWAARLSFLLFTPAVMGALLLELLKIKTFDMALTPVIAGTLMAAVSGYLALIWLVKLVRKGSFFKFAPYCWLAGLLGLIFI